MFHKNITIFSNNYIKLTNTGKLIVLYYKLLKKIKNYNSHIWFNKKCVKLNIIPNYINVKCNSSSNQVQKAINKLKKTWLNSEIKKWYSALNNVTTHRKIVRSELIKRLHQIEFDVLDEKTNLECDEYAKLIYSKKQYKLSKIKSRQNKLEKQTNISVNNKQFYPRVINISDQQFSQEEITLLDKGLKYSPTDDLCKKDFIKLAADVEVVLNNDNLVTKALCTNILTKDYNKVKQQTKLQISNENPIIKNIKNKIVNSDIIFKKADKGNSLVILNNNDYNTKIMDFLKESQAMQLKSDPTKRFQTNVKNCIKSCKNILKDQNKLAIMNPKAPNLYGLPKLHKTGIPIRPVVSYTNAPAYRLCRAFNFLFVENTNFISKFSIKNSLDLIDKVINVNVPCKCKLVSFDVISLFTSIPILKLKQIVYEFINIKIKDNEVKSELKLLFDTCLDQNYFKYGNNFFKFNNGLPMGSPLSPLLAEIYMNFLENIIFGDKNPFTDCISFWYRYVDDVLCLWKGTDRQLNNFLIWLNNLDTNIQFTIETEQNCSINFLDITLTRLNNRLSFNIYRKPTFSDNVIPITSRHSSNIKLSSFHSMLDRLIKIPLSKEFFDKELHTIKQIAINNGFPCKTIDKLLLKKQKKFIFNTIFSMPKMNDERWIKLNYIGTTSDKISNILKNKLNCNVAFYNTHNLKKIFNKKPEHSDKICGSGVYKITCNDCEFIYIGQTGRNFKTRFNEHFRSFKYNKNDSNLAKHLLEENHNCNINNLKVLHNENKGKKLNILESFEIKKALTLGKSILNDQTDLLYTPILNAFI